jgi:hypothetical protein
MRPSCWLSSSSSVDACMNRSHRLAHGSGRSCEATSTTTRYRETPTVSAHSAIG